MNTLLYILIASYGNLLGTSHDVPIAVFHLSASDSLVQLAITLDLEDFVQASALNHQEVNQETAQTYLNEHTNFQFNDQSRELHINKFKVVRDHIKIKGSLGKISSKITAIQIENTCLIDIPKHSNVIQIDLNGVAKDYRMHKNRTVITVSY